MSVDEIEDLKRRMAEAAAAEDYELAARLRDQLAGLEAGQKDESLFRRQVPGRMGLGSDQQPLRPPEGWTPPRKPNLMTANHKPRGGGRGRQG